MSALLLAQHYSCNPSVGWFVCFQVHDNESVMESLFPVEFLFLVTAIQL